MPTKSIISNNHIFIKYLKDDSNIRSAETFYFKNESSAYNLLNNSKISADIVYNNNGVLMIRKYQNVLSEIKINNMKDLLELWLKIFIKVDELNNCYKIQHGDIQAKNIVYDNIDDIRLIDFEFASVDEKPLHPLYKNFTLDELCQTFANEFAIVTTDEKKDLNMTILIFSYFIDHIIEDTRWKDLDYLLFDNRITLDDLKKELPSTMLPFVNILEMFFVNKNYEYKDYIDAINQWIKTL